MALIADILLISAAIAAGFYCYVLARRLQKLDQLNSGVGQAIKTLTEQLSDTKSTLEQASCDARENVERLDQRIETAKDLLERLKNATASSPDPEESKLPDLQIDTELQPDAAISRPATTSDKRPIKRRFGPGLKLD